ncbi:hypothetical protein D3C71_1255520 [compost metagenome]
MWVIAVVGAAPCQCFWPGGIQTTSPGLISCTGSPQRCTRPAPAVTTRVWPTGCVCHAVRAPGSNVTYEPVARVGPFGLGNRGSMRTVPEKNSAGPLADCCEPLREICRPVWCLSSCASAEAAIESEMAVMARDFINGPGGSNEAREESRRRPCVSPLPGSVQCRSRPRWALDRIALKD